jgi:L-malate glycosyltransferase
LISVCHIASGDLWAGAESMIFNLLSNLRGKSALSLSAIILNEGILAQKLLSLGVTVHILDEKHLSFLQIFQKSLEITGGNPPNIFHSHRYKENLLSLLMSRYRTPKKRISTLHGLPEFHGKPPTLNQRLKIRANYFFLSRFFTAVAVSQDIRKTLLDRFGFQNTKVEVIHNGIECSSPNLTGNRNSDPFVIGSSGRLFSVKDFPLMVEIAKIISERGVNGVRFEIAGDGPDMSAIESLIKRYGLSDSFLLKGHVNDMDSFYRGLDLYINTSVHEGIPMTILEAMSHGLPVIAPAVGGFGEIFDDGKEGFLVKTRSPHDFAEKCLFLKNNSPERSRMSSAAKEKVEREFSAQNMAEKYFSLYLRVMGLN